MIRPTSTAPLALRGSRARIVEELRRGPRSAKQLAEELGTTHNAVRAHLAALMRAGLVREAGRQPGVTRPTMLYEFVARAESTLSQLYVPFVAHLLRALGEQMTSEEMDALMRSVGKSMATAMPPLRGGLRQRVGAANALLQELGALTDVTQAGKGYMIRGHGCLLADAVHGRREVCRSVESLLHNLLDAPVKECCEHGERPKCCFQVSA
jgi:predicted ArsR family transcriptional regulator